MTNPLTCWAIAFITFTGMNFLIQVLFFSDIYPPILNIVIYNIYK